MRWQFIKRSIAVLVCFMLCISATGCASTGASGSKTSGTIGFENVENDPNNMLMGGKLAFNEDYIFYSDGEDNTIYRMGYDGKGVTPIADLDGRENIDSMDIAEAIGYRNLDKKLWR